MLGFRSFVVTAAAALLLTSIFSSGSNAQTKRIKDLTPVTATTSGDVLGLDSAASGLRGITPENFLKEHLAALKALTTAANKCIYYSAANTPVTMDCLSWIRSVISAADASAGRTAFGLAIGTDVQAYDAELAAIAGLTSAADKVPYFTGSGTAAVADFTASGRAMVATASAAAQTALLSAFTGDSGSGGVKGLVPAPASGDTAANKYLHADGTFKVVSGVGLGDVTGSASSTDNAVVRFDSTSGKIIQNSVVIIGDTGAVSGVTTLAMTGALTYAGVTLTNAVTGTGSMVLSASPTFTGTLTVPTSAVTTELKVASCPGGAGSSVCAAGILNSAGSQPLCWNTTNGNFTSPGAGGCTTSAARFKNIAGPARIDAGAALDRLSVVSGHWKDTREFDSREHVWLIADEVAAMDERCAARNPDGEIRSYEDRCVLAYLVKANQQLRRDLAEVKRALRQR